MSIQTQIERLERLRDSFRIKLMGMDLVGQSADFQECVSALADVEVHGYTYTPITDPNEPVVVAEGYYPEGCIVAVPPSYAQKIIGENIRMGVSIFGTDGTFTSGSTAEEENILEGKTAYCLGEKITGSMPDNGNMILSLDGLERISLPIPAGYHGGGGTVSLTDDIESELSLI